MSVMPAPFPQEFRQRAVQLAREGTTPVAKIAKDLGISESCLRNWMAQSDAEENSGGQRLAGTEKRELADLRKRNRILEQENEILRRAAAYFARENVLPK
jgi:transposase